MTTICMPEDDLRPLRERIRAQRLAEVCEQRPSAVLARLV